jgi:hypothetical protein
MKQTLEKINQLLNSIDELNEVEQAFITNYLEDISRLYRYRGGHQGPETLDLLELYNFSKSKNIFDFAFFLLEKAYTEDDNFIVSEISGLLRGNCPINNQIESILLKGIEDTSKSNRLRERFFWIYNYDFKNSGMAFFKNRFQKFIDDNWENPELVGEITDYLHWNFNDTDIGTKEISKSIKEYLLEKPEAKKQIHSSTKKILGIE